MQNKPNVKDAIINVSSFVTSKYAKMDTWLSGENKPNSNPIKPKTNPIKANFKLFAVGFGRSLGHILFMLYQNRQ